MKIKYQSSQIPDFQISEKVIRNTKLLLNRERLLDHLPKNGIVAELGVDEGIFSELILSTCKPAKLFLVDVWDTQNYNSAKRELVSEKFKAELESGVVEIKVGFSTEVGLKFNDGYFDWIYIDTDHSYQNTKKELEIWRSKVKEGGIIAGHDFIKGYWDGLVRYGVMEAVYEFCSEYNWEIIYLTMEISGHPSFAIRKMN